MQVLMICNKLLILFVNVRNLWMYVSDEGAKNKYDAVRTCKERTAKCEIKSNYLEKLNNKACCTKTQ